MALFSWSIWITGTALQAVLLLRARQGRFLSRFPVYFSYLGCALAVTLAGHSIRWLIPRFYPTFYWFSYLTILLVEFGVLVEISDHIFEPVPAIRMLGRFLFICVAAAFLVAYIMPALIHPKPSESALLEITLRLSVTKAVIAVVLLAAAWYYRLLLGRNVGGLMLGFGLYHGVYIAVLSAFGTFGNSYAPVLWFALPLGSTLCLMVWTIAMWRFEPVRRRAPKFQALGGTRAEPLSYQLDRFNTVLTRLLQK